MVMGSCQACIVDQSLAKVRAHKCGDVILSLLFDFNLFGRRGVFFHQCLTPSKSNKLRMI